MARQPAAAAPAFHRFDPAAGAEAEAGVNHPVVVKPEPAEKSSEKLHHTPAATFKPVTCPYFAPRNSGGVGNWRDYYSQYFHGTGDDVRHVCRTNDIAVDYWTGGSPILSILARALAGPEST